MKNIYCISGLGADYRLFCNLEVEGYHFVTLPWADFDNSDDMSTYAEKMYRMIPEPEPIILGLSFGGMLTTEICKIHEVRQAFVVSSAKTRAELGYQIPSWFVHGTTSVLPLASFNTPFWFALDRLGAQTDEEKKLLRQVMSDANPKFVKWCIKTLLSWTNTEVPAGIIHIHGTKDRVIPGSKVNANHWIKDGSHIMIYNRAAEINKLISSALT
jgi:pimeloyl-ACP methyl ester carboxylesterase